MPRTSNRRWKGCAMCKDWKFAGHGDAYRMGSKLLKSIGAVRRVSRHHVEPVLTEPDPLTVMDVSDCIHGCPGYRITDDPANRFVFGECTDPQCSWTCHRDDWKITPEELPHEY